MRAYEEIVDFIAAGTSSAGLVNFHPSAETKARVWDLIQREKADGLTPEETSELEHYLQLEHILRLTKARALQYLADQ